MSGLIFRPEVIPYTKGEVKKGILEVREGHQKVLFLAKRIKFNTSCYLVFKSNLSFY